MNEHALVEALKEAEGAWPTTADGEELDFENFNVLRVVCRVGGDWQEPVEITFEPTFGGGWEIVNPPGGEG